VELCSYWTLDAYATLKFQRKDDYYEGIRHHFEEAVKCRIRSHYPVGVELSGGLDSSAITGVASHFFKPEGKQIVTFSAISDGSTPDVINGKKVEDERYMKEVIGFNKIEESVFVNKELWENPLDEVDFLLKVNDGLDEYNQTYLAIIKNEAMLRNVRTMLSGFPGDEMVTYRGVYYFLDYLDHKKYLKYFLAEKEFPFKKIKPFLGRHLEFVSHKLRNILYMNGPDMRLAAGFYPIPFKYRFTKGDVVWKDITYLERYKTYRHYQKYRLLKPMVPMRMENETRFGLYFKTEPRFPMADIRLTQFYLSMPNEIKYEGNMERSAWRTAMREYLPDAVLNRAVKFGLLSPFRNNPETEQNRRAVLLNMLNTVSNNPKYKNQEIIKLFENKRNMIRYIEILRWLEKNFGNFGNFGK
jgi:asparagine synthase (glutamine-hydrolysing)